MATNEQDELSRVIRRIFENNTMPEAGDPELTMFDTDAVIDELTLFVAQHTKEAERRARIEGARQFWIWFQPIMVDIWNGDITDPADIDKKVAKYQAELSAPQQSTSPEGSAE